MKSKEELNALREEVEKLNAKLEELTENEMEQVTGGIVIKSPKFFSPLLRLNDSELGGTAPGESINSIHHNLIITTDDSEFGA